MTGGFAVVGSGPAGVACTRALLDAGAEVTLFDGGREPQPETADRYEPLSVAEPSAWDPELVQALREEFEPSLADVPLKTVLGSLHPYALDDPATPGPDTGIPTKVSLGRGGLSTVWGAAIAPYRDRDLMEWPFGVAALADHYRAVLRFVPLAGERDDLERILPLYTDAPGALEPTPQIAALLADLRAGARRLRARGIVAGRARLAVQTGPHGPGSPCRRVGLCLHGCPYDAIYRTDREVDRLLADPRLRYRPGAIVERVEEGDGAVMLRFRDGAAPARFARVFVAAGVLASTRLMLAAADAGDRAVEIQDSQYFNLPLLRAPGAEVSVAGSGNTLAQAFVEIDDPAVSAHTVHLQVYGYSDLVLREVAARLRARPAWLERHGQPLLGRLMLAQGYLHSNSSDPIRVALDRDGGLAFERAADASRPAAEVRRVGRALLAASGSLRALPLLPQLKLWEPGRGNHLGGAFPMARRATGLQSDLLGRVAGHERVHVVDGAVLPTIPATTVTLSVMANAHRIGHDAAAL